MKSSRRELLRNAALVAGSVLGSRPLSALGERPVSSSEIRRKLAAKRATIKTLYVDYQYRANPPGDVDLSGRHQMYFSRGRYHHRISLAIEPVELITITHEARVLTATVAGGTVEQVRVRDRTSRDPGMSLGSFLPVPLDLPMTPRGHRALAGQACHGILQGSDCYWVDLRLGVVRAIETYRSETWISSVRSFESFVPISDALHFPHLLKLRSFGESGRSVMEAVCEVAASTLNEPLPEELFGIDSFPRMGERLALG